MKHEIKVRKFDPPNGDQLSCVIFYERSPRVQVSRRESVVVVYPTKKFFVYFFINRETFFRVVNYILGQHSSYRGIGSLRYIFLNN